MKPIHHIVANEESFPKIIHLESVSGCNARCTMCTVNLWQRSKNLMSDRLFNKAVEELSQWKSQVEQVVLQQDGEPLLDKKLAVRIRALKTVGMRQVTITTNASLLTECKSIELVEAGLDRIDFSMDGHTQKTFEAIRINLSFDECLKNIHKFIAIRNASGRHLPIRVRMVIQPSNVDEVDAFFDYWERLLGPNDTILGKFELGWTNWREEVGNCRSQRVREKPPIDAFNEAPCASVLKTLVVLSDGRVPLCCLDYNAAIEFGDFNKSTIQSIWNNSKFRNIRDIHSTVGRLGVPMCVGCGTFAPGANITSTGICRSA